MKINKKNCRFGVARIFFVFSVFIFLTACSGGGNSNQPDNSDTPQSENNNQVPESPSHLIANAISHSQIGLTWHDNSDNETGFIIERALDNTFDTANSLEVGANITSYSDVHLTADTRYFYRVIAVNAIGDSDNTDSVDCRSNSMSPSALTPVARWDVVPYQRITNDETFNIGVVAFSKAGIDRVSFTISGQGYSGTNPLMSTSMSHNSRTDVYEYWVPLQGSDFASDGVFTVLAGVYGGDGGLRNLEALQFVVNATGNHPKPAAWVSQAGDNMTGEVGNSSQPYATVDAAVGAIQNMNGDSSDGAVVYLSEGSYTLDGRSANTSNEWLTLTRATGAGKENTIIIDGGSVGNTDLLKIDGLTLESQESGNPFFSSTGILWINDSRIIGSGRHSHLSNPAFRGTNPSYYTDTYIYDIDYGLHCGLLARGITIEHVGNDPFVNVLCVINARVDDVDPGSTYWHADGYQSWGDGAENRIIYGYYGTDLHYQGLFLRGETVHENNAFVNIFMEMRTPGRPGSPGGNDVLKNGSLYGVWDHLILWHCTFPTEYFSINTESIGREFTNSSFMGNMFYEYRENVTANGGEPEYSLPGNTQNNEFIQNHYIWSTVDTGGGGPSEPHWYSKSPDSDPDISQSLGDPGLDLSDPSLSTFGKPVSGSPLIDRITTNTVPIDALGNPRDQNPDIGALEYIPSE